ncbi:MAG: hypothetical protein KatS3mg027_1545 [Bacteroidia bacterium]|nr:MAG: hypothetical protein KatS3mg027_1545 [Bacteroidia bacterium]
MKTNSTIWVIVLSFFTFISSQAQVSRILCGDALYKEYLNQKYPGFKESYEKTLQQISEQVKNNQILKTNTTQYTVNVVVHVVWKDSVENLADSIIYNQIQVLNEDYNRLNADTINLRSIFNPIVGRAGIHFNLFQIIRKHTNTLFNVNLLSGGMPNQMKYDSLGGSDAIDPTHYLNIWVCKIQPIMFGNIQLGQILGFAFPPNNLSNWPSNSGAPDIREDGVVIDYRCFGRNNPNVLTMGSQTITIKGRTPTHEVGHYFGLRHIWGDGATLGNNNCTGDDGIQDTPNANNQSNFDCNTSKNTCVDTNLGWTTVDMPDLIENYMDYSSEDCMNMFTQGQVNWMITTLTGPRSGLLNANSITELNQSVNFQIYPNPAKEEVVIYSSEIQGPMNVRIYDISGKLIQNLNVELMNGKAKLKLNELGEGMYMLHLINEKHSKIMKLLVD